MPSAGLSTRRALLPTFDEPTSFDTVYIPLATKPVDHEHQDDEQRETRDERTGWLCASHFSESNAVPRTGEPSVDDIILAAPIDRVARWRSEYCRSRIWVVCCWPPRVDK